MSFRLGLTGSIGMGKSTTAEMFRRLGCAVWDADAAVHRLYDRGGLAVEQIRALFPDAIDDGAVSRKALKKHIAADPENLKRIEKIVHPLVLKDRQEFIAAETADILVFDIPLLFETKSGKTMDAVACVTVSPEVQRERVLARGTMTETQFEHILENQMPDSAKRALADYVIETDTLEHAQAQVQDIIRKIRKRLARCAK